MGRPRKLRDENPPLDAAQAAEIISHNGDAEKFIPWDGNSDSLPYAEFTNGQLKPETARFIVNGVKFIAVYRTPNKVSRRFWASLKVPVPRGPGDLRNIKKRENVLVFLKQLKEKGFAVRGV